jgi:hypothetical protein
MSIAVISQEQGLGCRPNTQKIYYAFSLQSYARAERESSVRLGLDYKV